MVLLMKVHLMMKMLCNEDSKQEHVTIDNRSHAANDLLHDPGLPAHRFGLPGFMDPPLDPDPEDFDGCFQRIVASSAPLSSSVSASSRFVKRSKVQSVKLSSTDSKRKVVTLSKKWLTSLFTGLWPSPRSVEVWLNKN